MPCPSGRGSAHIGPRRYRRSMPVPHSLNTGHDILAQIPVPLLADHLACFLGIGEETDDNGCQQAGTNQLPPAEEAVAQTGWPRRLDHHGQVGERGAIFWAGCRTRSPAPADTSTDRKNGLQQLVVAGRVLYLWAQHGAAVRRPVLPLLSPRPSRGAGGALLACAPGLNLIRGPGRTGRGRRGQQLGRPSRRRPFPRNARYRVINLRRWPSAETSLS